jgi:hypothetical protein
MKCKYGLYEVALVGKYTKFPDVNFEIILNESDELIWEKYIRPTLLYFTNTEYKLNKSFGYWPVSDFNKYTYARDKDNFLNVTEIYIRRADNVEKYIPHRDRWAEGVGSVEAYQMLFDYDVEYEYAFSKAERTGDWERIFVGYKLDDSSDENDEELLKSDSLEKSD